MNVNKMFPQDSNFFRENFFSFFTYNECNVLVCGEIDSPYLWKSLWLPYSAHTNTVDRGGHVPGFICNPTLHLMQEGCLDWTVPLTLPH